MDSIASEYGRNRTSAGIGGARGASMIANNLIASTDNEQLRRQQAHYANGIFYQ